MTALGFTGRVGCNTQTTINGCCHSHRLFGIEDHCFWRSCCRLLELQDLMDRHVGITTCHISRRIIYTFFFSFLLFFGYTIATSFQCTITTLIEILATLSLLDNRFLRMIDHTAFSSIGPLHEVRNRDVSIMESFGD